MNLKKNIYSGSDVDHKNVKYEEERGMMRDD